MKNILKIEELAMFIFSMHFFSLLDYAWWWFPALLLTPDISMLGYLVNSKTGAVIYNFFHHKAVALIVWAIGIYFEIQSAQLIGIILFAHSNFDRVFGYGLKYFDSFQNTHLGLIGKKP